MFPKFIGKHTIRLDETDSTNKHLAELIIQGNELESGAVVIANFQAEGKGRGNHSWESEYGKNLLLSVYYKPINLESQKQFYLNIAVSLGVRSFVKKVVPHEKITVKWPNDIYINNRKAGGLLIQNTISGNLITHSIIGIGINVNQIRFSPDIPNATSLMHFTGRQLDLEQCLANLCNEFNRVFIHLEQTEYALLRTHYLDALYGKDALRSFIHEGTPISARIRGISDYGELVLETTDGGKIECDLNEIEFII